MKVLKGSVHQKSSRVMSGGQILHKGKLTDFCAIVTGVRQVRLIHHDLSDFIFSPKFYKFWIWIKKSEIEFLILILNSTIIFIFYLSLFRILKSILNLFKNYSWIWEHFVFPRKNLECGRIPCILKKYPWWLWPFTLDL